MTFAILLDIIVYGQRQTDSGTELYQSLIPTDKQELLKNVDVIFNTRFAFDNQFSDGRYEGSKFDMNQFRLEIKGKIHEKVYFRFRDRYTKATDPTSRDNISGATDLALISVEIAPKTKVSMGKLFADWGGYEFDLNPIHVLEYNDIIQYSDGFLTGVEINHKLNDRHEIAFQVLNSRSRNFNDIYGLTVRPEIIESKSPLAFVTNWRGSFFGGKFETIYSFSYFNEAKNKSMNYIALGNKYQNNKFTLMYDFQYSNEALDRKGIVSNIIKDNYEYTAEDVVYIDNWIRAEYLVAPRVNLLLTLMTNSTYWNGNTDPTNAYGRIVTTYGFIPSVQYIPFKNLNLRFYVSYVGRSYNYSEYSKNNFGQEDYNTGRLSFGFIAPLLVL